MSKFQFGDVLSSESGSTYTVIVAEPDADGDIVVQQENKYGFSYWVVPESQHEKANIHYLNVYRHRNPIWHSTLEEANRVADDARLCCLKVVNGKATFVG